MCDASKLPRAPFFSESQVNLFTPIDEFSFFPHAYMAID
jgi:hypothetical protein